MFYEPFSKVEEVEPYFGKVVSDNGKIQNKRNQQDWL